MFGQINSQNRLKQMKLTQRIGLLLTMSVHLNLKKNFTVELSTLFKRRQIPLPSSCDPTAVIIALSKNNLLCHITAEICLILRNIQFLS